MCLKIGSGVFKNVHIVYMEIFPELFHHYPKNLTQYFVSWFHIPLTF